MTNQVSLSGQKNVDTKYRDLVSGMVFCFPGTTKPNLYMKMDSNGAEGKRQCVALNSGSVYNIDDHRRVIPVEDGVVVNIVRNPKGCTTCN